jgi:hypothetical protein
MFLEHLKMQVFEKLYAQSWSFARRTSSTVYREYSAQTRKTLT